MAKKLNFLLLMILCFLFSTLLVNAGVVGTTSWVNFGGNQTSDGIVGAHTIGGFSDVHLGQDSYNFTSYNLTFGQDKEMLSANLIGDSRVEGIIWSIGLNPKLRIINISDGGTTLDGFFTTLELYGQPTIFDNKYMAIVIDPFGEKFFYAFNLFPSISVNYSFSLGSSSFSNRTGIACGNAFSQNRCVFMLQNFTMFNVNIDSNTYETYTNYTMANPQASFDRNVIIPVVKDLHKDGGLDAIFTLVGNMSSQISRTAIAVIDIFGNKPNAGMDGDGYVTLGVSFNGAVPNIVDEFTSTPFASNIIIAGGYGTSRMYVVSDTGTILHTGSQIDLSITNMAVLTCPDSTATAERGIVAMGGQTSGSNSGYSAGFLDFTNLASTNLGGNGTSASTLAFDTNTNSLMTADLTGDGNQEIIVMMKRSLTSTSAYVFSCTNLSHSIGNLFTDTNSKSYFFTGGDFNQDNLSDIVATANGATKIFLSNGFASFGSGSNVAPTISSITPSTPSPVNKGTSVFFTYSATDPELDPIYGAVKCESSDSYGAFSSANAGETSHDPCAYTTIGCKTATIAVTDNEAGRLTSVTPTSWTTSSSTQFLNKNLSIRYYCGDGNCNVNEDHTSCVIDCTISTCGDTTCQSTETSLTCPVDCLSATCGDATCDLVENFVSCPADCSIATCGDGVCSYPENTTNCPYDTFEFGTGSCGDTFCDGTETYSSCPADCTLITCGNNICGTGENTTSCPYDCGTCGNGVCEGQESSLNSPSYCVADCPSTDIELPLQLVNPDNLEEGLLPELYYGIRAFFSPFLIPLIGILIFLMIAMVFWAIATKLKQMGG